MRKFVLFGLLLVFVFAASVFAASVAGTWELHFNGPMGPESWNMTIEQNGEDLKIKANAAFLGSFEGKGTLKGDAVTMEFIHNTPNGIFKRVFSGTVEGNKMTGKSTLDGKPESSFDAVRK